MRRELVMPEVLHAGFRLHYEVLGDPLGVPLVLVAGSREQIGSVEFPGEQCALLVQRGFRVIRLDNRDAGLSVPIEPLSVIDVRMPSRAVSRRPIAHGHG